MRVLITGAAGFVGHHLSEFAVSQGADVVGVGRHPEIATDPPKCLERYLPTELLDPGQTEQSVITAKPDLVFHLAAEASVAASWEDPVKIMSDNVRTTLNVLEAVRRHAPDAGVMVAGSGEEYGPPATLPVDETHELRPQNPYAVSKAAADLSAGFYADAYGMRVLRMRPFNHCGPGQAPVYVVSSFARQIAEAEARGDQTVEVVTGSLDARRDFTDVRDVVRAYWMALESGESGVFNVASGRSVPVQEILDGLAVRAKAEVQQRLDPKLLRPNEVPDVVGSSEKLRAACGWEPQIDLQDTLSDTLEWWRENVEKTGVNS